MTTFMQEVRAGRQVLSQIDAWVERWHESDGGGSLREFLGLTPEEYADWLREPASLVAAVNRAQAAIPRYADPADPLNGLTYRTDKPCLTRGCPNQAGTHWSPLWCQPCNAKRLQNIDKSMKGLQLAALVKDVRLAGGVSIPCPQQE